jgi:hypothetical protein
MTFYDLIKTQNLNEMAKTLAIIEYVSLTGFCEYFNMDFIVDEDSIKVIEHRARVWKVLLESEVEE